MARPDSAQIDALKFQHFFPQCYRRSPSPSEANQFWFDVGGPIRKGQLFFFTSYQGTRQRTAASDVNCSQLDHHTRV